MTSGDRNFTLRLAPPEAARPSSKDTAGGATSVSDRSKEGYEDDETLGLQIPKPSPYFSGRQDVEERLRTHLSSEDRVLVAITGLPGVGKTQMAAYMAHQLRRTYDVIVWIQSNTRENLVSDFASAAKLLKLSDHQDPDQDRVIHAVKGWLERNRSWLLIFDNANEFQLVQQYFPDGKHGHILITTRTLDHVGIARSVSLKKLSPEKGADLFLMRAGFLQDDRQLGDVADKNREVAALISTELDGLPLALSQAGAFVAATKCHPSEYLEMYQNERISVPSKSLQASEIPAQVTISLAFKRLSAEYRIAANLLMLCAFFAPDAIPETVLGEGLADLGEDFKRSVSQDRLRANAIQAAARFDLLTYDASSKSLRLHRLVQRALLQLMDDDTRRAWAERAVKALSDAFPEPVFGNWPECDRLLPHIHACLPLETISQFRFPEAALLVYNTGVYLWERAKYSEALRLLQLSLTLFEDIQGQDHPNVAKAFHGIADTYREIGKFVDAKRAYEHEISIWERKKLDNTFDYTKGLHGLALLHHLQGKYEDAEPLYKRALDLRLGNQGSQDFHAAWVYNDLAVLYGDQGRSDEAEALFLKALDAAATTADPDHYMVALVSHNLAQYCRLDNYEEANRLFHLALKIREKAFGPNHRHVAGTFHGLALLELRHGNLVVAERLFLNAIGIWEKELGPQNHDLALGLYGLSRLYRIDGRYDEAKTLCVRAISIRVQTSGETHPLVVEMRNELENINSANLG